MGATWINQTTQPNVYALAEKFGLETFPQYTSGDSVFEGLDGNPSKGPGSFGGECSVSGRVEAGDLCADIAAARSGHNKQCQTTHWCNRTSS